MDSQPAHDNSWRDMRKNPFAKVSIGCGVFGILCYPYLYSPLLMVTPFVAGFGILIGLVGLVIYSRRPRVMSQLILSSIGCFICAFSFYHTGIFYAKVLNISRVAMCGDNHRQVAIALLFYAKDHGGKLPKSLCELDYPPEKMRSCRIYTFYYWYEIHPFLLNGYLAGKGIDKCKYPSQTIMIADGIHANTDSLYSKDDIFLTLGSVTFIDGSTRAIEDRYVDKHFPADGKITKDSWIIKPK